MGSERNEFGCIIKIMKDIHAKGQEQIGDGTDGKATLMRCEHESEARESRFKNSEEQLKEVQNVQEAGAAGFVPRDTKADVDLIRSISAGMVLKGYFLTNDKSASAECKQMILQCPVNATLIAPTMPGGTHEFELSSKTKRIKFQHALKNGGLSVAASLRYGSWGIEKEASANYKKAYTKGSKTKDVTNFGSKTKVSFVPTKAFTLNETNYKLSTAAVKALTDIEKSLDLDKSTVIKKCGLFFDKFGSHFYTGIYHFGGIYEWSATVETTEEISKSEVMDLCSTALDGNIKAGYSGFISGGISAARHTDESTRDTNSMTTEHLEVKTELCKIGGPQEVDDFEAWKQGLVSQTDTWHVIDRDEMTSGKYEGVWKLILNTPDFQNPLTLALTMMESWEHLSGLQNDTDSFLYIDMIAELVADLKGCELINNDKLLRLLQKLDNTLDKIKDKLKSDEVLAKLCDDDTKDILQRICEQENTPNIEFLAGKILELSKQRSTSTSPVGKVLGELETVARQFHTVDFFDDHGVEKLQISITQQIQKSLQGLHDKDLLQFIFFNASLVDLGQETFDYTDMSFRHSLSENDIHILIKNTRKCLEDIYAFYKTIRGIFDAKSCTACLERLQESLRIVFNDIRVSGEWSDYLTKDTRTQNFLEIVARHMHKVEDDSKTKMLQLFTELLKKQHGRSIRLRKSNTTISFLEKAASCDQRAELLQAAGLVRLPIGITQVDKFIVRMKDKDCCITGIGVTADGTILLVEFENRKIKLCSRSGQMMSYLGLKGSPEHVTAISRTEAAITFSGKLSSTIQIINLADGKNMSVKRSIRLRNVKNVFALMAYGKNLIISCSDRSLKAGVRLIDMDGDVIWTKDKDIWGAWLFGCAELYLTINPGKDCDRVIVTDKVYRRLVVLAANTGDILKLHSITQSEPSHVTVDSCGRIYVYDAGTGEISVLSADLEEEMNLGAGLQELNPSVITCDRTRDELLVSSYNDLGHIHRFGIIIK